MKNYNFMEVEKKWKEQWDKEKPFKAIDFHPTKPKYYVLYEFFNVSGNLHMGHLKGSVPADALARYKRFNGYNVLFPIGGDAFGLPAEGGAIKAGISPQQFVKTTMKKILDQTQRLGLSFDFDRTICTSDPEFYKWTQWIFLQLFKNKKAYKQRGYVNFCPKCKTVLSNEDSQGGECDRCGSSVVQEERWVWFLKMKEYSEKLLNNVDKITMTESLKEAQRNWIGKSEGMQVSFDLVDEKGTKLDKFEIFTTCVETVYGITFISIAPEHNLINKHINKIKNIKEVNEYKSQTALRSEFDRMADQKEKTGCEIKGLYAINPVNGARVPLYLADFVLAGYGTGIVMAVPSHDQRDYEFATKFNMPMIQVIEGDCSKMAIEKKEYIQKNSKMLNSGEFTGWDVKKAKKAIANKIISMGVGSKQTNYKMGDWPFNRQRYWGEPFPVVFCDKCGTVSLNENDLPLKLPLVKDYKPNEKGDSPLAKATRWVNCSCPNCGAKAKRETDTMPNWAGSSWYWLRYCDPHNSEKLADYEKLKYWGSVDCYTGGTEHITRHVLYAFFWQNFLYEIGAVPTRDPFIKKMGSGLILDSDGQKMSKSSTNGVSPMEIVDKYGADVTRLHTHFLAAYEDSVKWTLEGIGGITTFLTRVWNLQNMVKGNEVSKEHRFELATLIKKVSEDVELLKMNTATAAFMTFIKKIKEDGFITKEELRQFVILLNPFAPFITSELFENVFKRNILNETWPKVDETALVKDEIEMPVQVTGKMRGVIKIKNNATQNDALNAIKSQLPDLTGSALVKKVIFVPNKIINIII